MDLRFDGDKRLVTLFKTKDPSARPRSALISGAAIYLLICAVSIILLKEFCIALFFTSPSSKNTPLLNLAFECRWLSSKTRLKAVSAIFLTVTVYCHLVKASLTLERITTLNKFWELSREVARNFNFALRSIENLVT